MKNLVIFDFSGTLSLGAVAFAREDALLEAFTRSGLWRLGLKDSSIFWNEIVAPTWELGSTTTIGYAQLLYERLASLLSAVPPEALRVCISAFATEYFRSSRLETEWLPLLGELVEQAETGVLIATDHYAEASRYILSQCEACGISAEVLDSNERRKENDKIYIANSADFGAVKAKPQFWKTVRKRLCCGSLEQIIIVDDFGGNEASGDSYGTEEKVMRRHAATEAIVSASFECSVRAFPFTLSKINGRSDRDAREKFQELITKTEYFIKETCRSNFPVRYTRKSMMNVITESIWNDLAAIRKTAPLVHNITNYVVMNNTANALLSLGASPVMAHAENEVEDMVNITQALVINIGTLSDVWIRAMLKAAARAKKNAVPIVLDPVGAGATPYRTETVHRLLSEASPSIIRGNASEIMAITMAEAKTKGVDSLAASDSAIDAARELSAQYECVVCISGEIDYIVEADRAVLIRNGHPMMPKVTGLGCTASAICGAFSAVNASAFEAASHAMSVMGIAGEIAAEQAKGPGTLQLHFLDALYTLSEDEIIARSRREELS